ncbi:MAG TPA: TdeIII family type II restriction endonuclease [Pyrinomonadaceae bacterium]
MSELYFILFLWVGLRLYRECFCVLFIYLSYHCLKNCANLLLTTNWLGLHSFIHSLNTNFGTSVFEPVAVALAKSNFADAKAQMKAGKQISITAGRCAECSICRTN